MISFIQDSLWYGDHKFKWVLSPFSFVFQIVVRLRRWFLEHFFQVHFDTPVIVIGNITVGGVGKTPLVIALCKQLQARGVSVGIVSRGYGSSIKHTPYLVSADDSADLVGDEPLLIAQKSGVPVVIAAKRVEAVRYLVKNHPCDVIISDDGLQHYKMGRAIEIAVVDGSRALGNGFCLPAGPLREPKKRLEGVDFVLVNGGHYPSSYAMRLVPGAIYQLNTTKRIPPEEIAAPVAAIAAIGNPQRFYSTLRELSIQYNAYSYPDHYVFSKKDLEVNEPMILMTEKDAVKCKSFADDNCYVLPVDLVVEDAFWSAFWSHQKIKDLVTDERI